MGNYNYRLPQGQTAGFPQSDCKNTAEVQRVDCRSRNAGRSPNTDNWDCRGVGGNGSQNSLDEIIRFIECNEDAELTGVEYE